MPDLKAHHYDRLRVLAVGPRAYSVNDAACITLLKWGLIQETDQLVHSKPYSRPPHRSYAITDAGRAFLSAQH
jgi:hypothetical protein